MTLNLSFIFLQIFFSSTFPFHFPSIAFSLKCSDNQNNNFKQKRKINCKWSLIGQDILIAIIHILPNKQNIAQTIGPWPWDATLVATTGFYIIQFPTLYIFYATLYKTQVHTPYEPLLR